MSAPLRIGVLGCARITKEALIEAAQSVPEVAVVAVASRDLTRAQAFAAKRAIPRALGSYEALLADPDIEAIYNPLPNSLHAEWTIRALEAGKAVLCEKPLASNAAEAQLMADAARRTGRPLVEGFHYRYHPLADAIVEAVRALGALRSIDVGLTMAAGFTKADDIRFDRALAGGAAMDLGAYCVNILRLITGEEPSVESANAIENTPGIDRTMRAQLVFPSGVAATLLCSLAHDTLGAWLKVEGENGVLEVNNPFLPQRGHAMSLTRGGETIKTHADRTPTYVYQLRGFVEVVRSGALNRTSAEDGVANMRVIDCLYRASGLTPRG